MTFPKSLRGECSNNINIFNEGEFVEAWSFGV